MNSPKSDPQARPLSGSPTRVIFLDFDGVLHPGGGPPGQSIPFCWVPHLGAELAPHEDVRIVVHSSWIELKQFTLDVIRDFLGPLGDRLIGLAPGDSKEAAIASYLSSPPAVLHALVIDDEAEQFGVNFAVPVLVCDPLLGLSDPQARLGLRDWLERSARSHS